MKENRIYKFNDAEGVFIPGFDADIMDMSELSGENCKIWKYWDTVKFDSTSETFSVTWSGRVYTGEYDTMQFYITVPEYIKMSATAYAGGKEIVVFSDVPGENEGPMEPCGKVPLNTYIEKVTMHFKAENSQTTSHTIGFSWAGLYVSDKLSQVTAFEKYDENSWDKYINYNNAPTTEYNVFFTDSEIEKIKENMQFPENRSIVESICENAKKLDDFQPEKYIGRYIPVKNCRYVRKRDRNRETYWDKVFVLAAGGYFFDNPKWTNLAARTIMSMAMCPCWYDGPQGNTEGSKWHHVCFAELENVREAICALGFLGGKFTPEGIEIIKNSIYTAYKTIVKCCKEQGYRKFCNQSMVEEAARMLGACGLFSLGMTDILCEADECIEEHTKIINNYINDELHCTEGPAYYQFSIGQSIYLWKSYSKMKNIHVTELVPPRVAESLKYANCITSSVDKCGSSVCFSDIHTVKFNELIIAFFSNEYHWKKGGYFAYNRSKQEKETVVNIIATLMLMCYNNKNSEISDFKDEKYYIFEKSGLASYEDNGSKFWFLAERNPRTGHFHRDRGSVILEYKGKRILADPGVGDYANWRTPYMQRQEYHNLAHPQNISMKLQSDIAIVSTDEAGIGCRTVVCAEDFLHPEAKINHIKAIENGISFSVNLEEIYPGVDFAKRDGYYKDFGEYAEIELNDQWKIPEAMPLWVNFVSYGNWEIRENTASVRIDNVKLTLTFESENAFELSEDLMISDGEGNQLYTLHLKTESANCHKIKTKGVISTI